jgi:exodeoxyribonuclease-3
MTLDPFDDASPPDLFNHEIWETEHPMPFESVTKIQASTKLMIWNANSFRKRWEVGAMQRLLRDTGPDTLLITELRTNTRAMLERLDVRATLLALGYRYCYWHWCRDESKGGFGYAGSALLSKIKPDHVSFGFDGDVKDEEGRVITATFSSFTFIGVYSPCSAPGLPTPRRVTFDTALTSHITSRQDLGQHIIFAGDMNVAPTTEDVRLDPTVEQETHSSCKPHERETFRQWTSPPIGLVDVYREFNHTPSSDDHTWHRSLAHFHRKLGMRIDHFLVSPELIGARTCKPNDPHIIDCNIVKNKYTSDHFPVVLELSTPQPTAPASTTIPQPTASSRTTSPPPEPTGCHEVCTCGSLMDYGNQSGE